MRQRNQTHPRPWHRGSEFGTGRRKVINREARRAWRCDVVQLRKAKEITLLHAAVLHNLIDRLNMKDGRCDPSRETLARDTGCCLSTVDEALKRARVHGVLDWTRRIVRTRWRAEQISNQYVFNAPAAPAAPPVLFAMPARSAPAHRAPLSGPFISPINLESGFTVDSSFATVPRVSEDFAAARAARIAAKLAEERSARRAAVARAMQGGR